MWNCANVVVPWSSRSNFGTFLFLQKDCILITNSSHPPSCASPLVATCEWNDTILVLLCLVYLLSTMFLMFLHIVAWTHTSFRFIDELYFIVWIYHICLFIHQLIYFQFLAIVHNVAMNIHIQVCGVHMLSTFPQVDTRGWNCWILLEVNV